MKSLIGFVVNVMSLSLCNQCLELFRSEAFHLLQRCLRGIFCVSTRCAAEIPTQHVATAEQKETKSLLRVFFVSFKIESFGWRLESNRMKMFGHGDYNAARQATNVLI